MAAPIVLGLDIGGANLKAATADKRAVSVPFALWKQPDRLPAALAELVANSPDAEELAVTMTGELCDCFETKREGVNAILDSVESVAKGRPVRVWSTDGEFVGIAESRRHHLRVAAANWHALATFAGRYVPEGAAVLIDVGSTTTDVIPIQDGEPASKGRTDQDRLELSELVYLGVRRTPVGFVLAGCGVCAELFATTQDVYVVNGLLPEDPGNCDTADGRPLTRRLSLARLARMLGGDLESLTETRILDLVWDVDKWIKVHIEHALSKAEPRDGFSPCAITSGFGEFLAKDVVKNRNVKKIISLTAELGAEVSACGPAYALAVLATERRP